MASQESTREALSASALESVRAVSQQRAEVSYAFEQAIRQAVAAGATHSAVAAAAGLTRGRVSQIVGASPATSSDDLAPPNVKRDRSRDARGPPR